MPRNPYYSGPTSDHFDGTRFFVPGRETTTDRTFRDVLAWRLKGRRSPWPAATAPDASDTPPARVAGAALRVAYIGHASLLIQTRGLNLLIDPVYAERASPVAFAGPKRVNPPGVAMAALPPLDAILVTHSHYDHLDVAALKSLAATHGCRVLTPLGNDTIMRRAVPSIRAEAYDWGERVSLSDEVSVDVEPSYHWSARRLSDRRMALWAAFVIRTPDGAIYHIGDTGYGKGEIFRGIRVKHDPVRLAIIPIGAYEPRWFMRDQHVDPEEAVRIYQDCGAAFAMAHHWGTFQLTDEAIDEPPKRLEVALERAGIPPGRFQVKRPGEVFEVPPCAA